MKRVTVRLAAHLDNLWPRLTDIPWLALLIYLVAFDFLGYWIYHSQHCFDWWWKLYMLRHSQPPMTMWADNRNRMT